MTMKDNKFYRIGDDPTKELDFKSISLDEQYTKLTDHEKLLVFAKMVGYRILPVSVIQMISDEFYLGSEKYFNHGDSVFPFWKEMLQKVFPSPVLTKTPNLVLGGAIGIGKSTVSRICLAVTYMRLLCMKNPSKTLGLANKPLRAQVFHKSQESAELEFQKWFYEMIKDSPFFRNTINPKLKWSVNVSGVRGTGGLGSDVLMYIISELNFYNPEVARQIVSTALIRMTSRFSSESLQLVGGLLLDSSAKDSSDATEWFLEHSDPELTWNCKPAHYEVRPNLYTKSEGKTFKVYSGDAKIPPQILPDDFEDKELLYDKDKILNVPIQLLPEFKTNIRRSLMDKCGVSLEGSNKFFPNGVEHIMNCSTITNKIPEIITVDFYNKEDHIREIIDPMLRNLSPGRAIWIGYDLSYAQGGDYSGCSICTFEGWSDYDGEGTKMPKIKCWCIFAVKNKEGQEISLFHFYQLVKDLSKEYNVIVSSDRAYSQSLAQDCERESIPFHHVSTDILPCNPAIYLKNIFNYELIEMPVHKRFQREASDLIYNEKRKGVIDHPAKASISPLFDNPDGKEVGSKDVWDSLANCVFSMKMSIDAGEEYGYNSGYNKQSQIISNLSRDPRQESQQVFQEMLENIW